MIGGGGPTAHASPVVMVASHANPTTSTSGCVNAPSTKNTPGSQKQRSRSMSSMSVQHASVSSNAANVNNGRHKPLSRSRASVMHFDICMGGGGGDSGGACAIGGDGTGAGISRVTRPLVQGTPTPRSHAGIGASATMSSFDSFLSQHSPYAYSKYAFEHPSLAAQNTQTLHFLVDLHSWQHASSSSTMSSDPVFNGCPL